MRAFVRAQAPGDFEEPDKYASQARLRGLDERRLGTLRAAISAMDLTVPLTSVTGLRVGESLEIGRSGNTPNGELMRIASIDTANNNVSVVERFDAFHFAAPQVWLTGTAVDHHRRARPENLPGYMVNSGQSPIIDTFPRGLAGHGCAVSGDESGVSRRGLPTQGLGATPDLYAIQPRRRYGHND